MILGINGRINSGKDTLGRIIQIIIDSPHFTNEGVLSFIDKPALNPKWKIKKFADKTTDAFYIITGINYHLLNRKEKEKTRPVYIKFAEGQKALFENDDIWVNVLMSEYDKGWRDELSNYDSPDEWWNSPESINGLNPYNINDWIITDMRFPNELKAVKDRGGITIRVNRLFVTEMIGENKVSWIPIPTVDYIPHESETALDNAEFDYTIDNNGTLLELVEKVRVILTNEKIV